MQHGEIRVFYFPPILVLYHPGYNLREQEKIWILKTRLKPFLPSEGINGEGARLKARSRFSTIIRLENATSDPGCELLERFHALQEKRSLVSLDRSDDIFDDVSLLIEKAQHTTCQSVNVLLIQGN